MLSRALDVEMAQARSRGLDDDELGAAVAARGCTYVHPLRTIPTSTFIGLPFFIRNAPIRFRDFISILKRV